MPSKAAYDPQYDPLVAPHPGEGRDYAPTYWVGTTGEPPADDGPVTGDMDVDAVTGGYNLQIAWSTGHLAGLCAAQEETV